MLKGMRHRIGPASELGVANSAWAATRMRVGTRSAGFRSIRYGACLGAVAIAVAVAVLAAENTKPEPEATIARPDTFTVPEPGGTYVIRIKNHRFHPDRLVVPAKRRIKLRIENHDRTVEEFESYDLNREKIVTGGRKITVFIGPLKRGTYRFFGEFHAKTAQGVVIAR